MDIKIGVKLHNRFDIEVKDIRTGKIVQRAKAENIVLDAVYSRLNSTTDYTLGKYIRYGGGSGTLAPDRTSLFDDIGYKTATVIEFVYNVPPIASYGKKSIVLLPEDAVGETITEVGLAVSTTSTTLVTHAMLEDSEGNPISIGPKTDAQEITIYSTLYAEVTSPEGMVINVPATEKNQLLDVLIGAYPATKRLQSTYNGILLSSDKSATNPTEDYRSGVDYSPAARFTSFDTPNKKVSTPRLRYGTSEYNQKIWSIVLANPMGASSNYGGALCRILLPSCGWEGYNFIGKAIGTGDGSTVAFDLPWSDINTSKTYKIYLDGIEKTEGVDYTLSNSESTTTVTFTTAPANGAAITGDWWVDYIPKDSDHVLDLTFSIQYGSV